MPAAPAAGARERRSTAPAHRFRPGRAAWPVVTRRLRLPGPSAQVAGATAQGEGQTPTCRRPRPGSAAIAGRAGVSNPTGGRGGDRAPGLAPAPAAGQGSAVGSAVGLALASGWGAARSLGVVPGGAARLG